MSLSPGWMLKILRAFAGITICPLSPTRDQPKGVPALGRYVQPGSGGVIVDEIVQRDAENFRQLLAALNVGQTFPGIT